MSKGRAMVKESGGLMREAVAGDGIFASPILSSIATDAAMVLTAAQISGGLVMLTGLSAGRVVTTDTAENILAAFPNLDIGDSALIFVSITVAFAATWAAGAGVTLAGRATTPASELTPIVITKTAAATLTWTVM